MQELLAGGMYNIFTFSSLVPLLTMYPLQVWSSPSYLSDGSKAKGKFLEQLIPSDSGGKFDLLALSILLLAFHTSLQPGQRRFLPESGSRTDRHIYCFSLSSLHKICDLD